LNTARISAPSSKGLDVGWDKGYGGNCDIVVEASPRKEEVGKMWGHSDGKRKAYLEHSPDVGPLLDEELGRSRLPGAPSERTTTAHAHGEVQRSHPLRGSGGLRKLA
jgi:hypothetical protein